MKLDDEDIGGFARRRQCVAALIEGRARARDVVAAWRARRELRSRTRASLEREIEQVEAREIVRVLLDLAGVALCAIGERAAALFEAMPAARRHVPRPAGGGVLRAARIVAAMGDRYGVDPELDAIAAALDDGPCRGPAAWRLAEAALALAERRGLPTARARAVCGWSHLANGSTVEATIDDFDPATAAFARLYGQADRPARRAVARRALAFAHEARGRLRLALALLEADGLSTDDAPDALAIALALADVRAVRRAAAVCERAAANSLVDGWVRGRAARWAFVEDGARHARAARTFAREIRVDPASRAGRIARAGG